MTLHRGQEEALVAFLNDLRIEPGGIINERTGEHFYPFRDQILKAKPWKDVLGESEFYRLLWRHVFRVADQIPDDFEGELSDFNDGKTLGEMAAGVRAALECIPGEYHVYVPMARVRSIEQAEIALTDSISLVDSAYDQTLRKALKDKGLTSGLMRALAGMDPMPTQIEDMRYLKIHGTGFCDWSPDSPVIRNSLSVAKQFLFACLGSGALVGTAHVKAVGLSLLNAPIVAIGITGEQETFISTLGFELSQFVHQLELGAALEVPVYTGLKSLLSPEMKAATSPEELRSAITSLMRVPIAFLSLDSADAISVRAAMEWYIDAEASENESVAFLQRCIGLEALLGSGESRREVTERLADRYAYTVGKTESERGRLRSSFKAMYAHRSEIVHGRATKLSESHRAANSDARSMLLNTAWREMQSLIRATKSGG